MKKILFLFILASLYGCSKDKQIAEEPPYLKFQVKNVTTSYLEYNTDVKVASNVYFDVEPKEYYSWVDYTNTKSEISIHLEKNYNSNKRECILIAKNEEKNVNDTLKITQDGYPASTGGNGDNGSVNNGGSNQSTSRQCAAITKKGKRCKRTASKGSIYCWQHKK